MSKWISVKVVEERDRLRAVLDRLVSAALDPGLLISGDPRDLDRAIDDACKALGQRRKVQA